VLRGTCVLHAVAVVGEGLPNIVMRPQRYGFVAASALVPAATGEPAHVAPSAAAAAPVVSQRGTGRVPRVQPSSSSRPVPTAKEEQKAYHQACLQEFQSAVFESVPDEAQRAVYRRFVEGQGRAAYVVSTGFAAADARRVERDWRLFCEVNDDLMHPE
jgi:hypothetical protein